MSVAKRDRVLPRLIEEEMRESFLDYSMSVIVQRALPDVRDGLKPVHRRILYAMHEAGLGPGRPYKKSATVVGDVLGKYHPHGDSAVYDSMVRMVQDFSLRYPLVDGQGNFGSIDGDNAAAYRYTEARLSRIATEMLADIDRDTVDFAPNFDDRLQEPRVLPARVPNLLVNGSSGIAVGMSTNVPPHNLGEVVSAAIHLLDHPECSVADLMEHLPGPDFPTGGLIVGTEGIRQAYRTGRGRVVMRARAIRETRRGGREQLVVTEIPYGTNKSRIIEQIADLAKRGKITEVADLRDESDREGIRIVVELKRDGDAARTLDALHRWTHLQSTFGVIMLALEGGVPREFGLKELLERFRDHRLEVTVRRSRWELARARDEAHVLEGLLVALKHIDAVVRLIRGSKTRDTAARKLQKEYTLSERQAEAILNMRLVRLTALETRELRDRLAELEARMAELEAILASPERRVALLRSELRALVEAYGDARRTRIVEDGAEPVLERATADEEVVVTVSREGYAKQIPMELYRRRLSSGKRLAGMERYESDYLERAFSVSTFATLLLFTEDGRAYGLPVEEIPEGGRASRGRSLHPLLGIPRRTRIVATLPLAGEVADRVVVFATAEGTVKRTPLDQFTQLRAGGVAAILLRPRDRVIAVELSDGEGELVLVGSGGRAIRFREEDAALMGRTAQGVRGIRLGAGERAVGMTVARREGELCTVSAGGWAKRTPIDELTVQGRGGLGAPFALLDAETGPLVAALEVGQGEDLMAVSVAGRLLRLLGEEVPREERGGRGVRVAELAGGEWLAEVTRVGSPRPSPDTEGEDDEIGAAEEAAQLELAPVAEEVEEE